MMNIGDFARLGGITPRMLRHYDQVGLLRPARVDDATGYRWYSAGQLARLHRLLAFRELGFTLEQIGGLLDGELALDELRGMLRLRRVQIQADVAEEHAKLRRVEAHLRALEGSTTMPADIVVKTAEPLRIAAATGSAPGFGHDNLGPVFDQLLPEIWSTITSAGAKPGISVAWYEWPDDEGEVVVHAGFVIGDQTVPETNGVRVDALPAVEVASVIHRGSMESITTTYEALVSWIERNGLQIAGRSRELYHEWNDTDPSQCVTELQMPISH
jgi:DNA-binding transcriptional MerR regulator/predicted transcriptional regulator YdeE